ncbi:MAG: DNA adenine methylase [Steroidobacteraceae bacterium]
MRYYAPLRYPGGKASLGQYMRQVFVDNGILDGVYVEPYAGGAAIGMELLMTGYAKEVWLNDIDPAVHAFWQAALNHSTELIERVRSVPLTIREWRRQRSIYLARTESATVDLGFSALYLNRTNRSGILNGGVIGGLKQRGKWLIDARFNRTTIEERLRRVAQYRHRIRVTCSDAEQFLRDLTLPKRALIYIDPPYYQNGQRLYRNSYQPPDHARVASYVQRRLRHRWIVSYDDAPAVAELYAKRRQLRYSLQYSAQEKKKGGELLVFSDGLRLPPTRDPGRYRVN